MDEPMNDWHSEYADDADNHTDPPPEDPPPGLYPHEPELEGPVEPTAPETHVDDWADPDIPSDPGGGSSPAPAAYTPGVTPSPDGPPQPPIEPVRLEGQEASGYASNPNPGDTSSTAVRDDRALASSARVETGSATSSFGPEAAMLDHASGEGAATIEPVPQGHAMPGDGIAGDPAGDAEWYIRQREAGLCVPTSIAQVVAEYTGHPLADADAVTQRALDNGWITYGPGQKFGNWSGMFTRDAELLLESYGIPATRIDGATLEQLEAYLEADHSVLASVDGYEIWEQGDAVRSNHTLVVTGVDRARGVVVLNDPGVDHGRAWEVPLTTFLDSWADSNNEMLVTDNPPPDHQHDPQPALRPEHQEATPTSPDDAPALPQPTTADPATPDQIGMPPAEAVVPEPPSTNTDNTPGDVPEQREPSSQLDPGHTVDLIPPGSPGAVILRIDLRPDDIVSPDTGKVFTESISLPIDHLEDLVVVTTAPPATDEISLPVDDADIKEHARIEDQGEVDNPVELLLDGGIELNASLSAALTSMFEFLARALRG